MPPFVTDMVDYLESFKQSVKKKTSRTNEFIQIARYKLSIQKSLAILHINSEHKPINTKNTINKISEKNKNLSINLGNYLQICIQKQLNTMREINKCRRISFA